MFYFHLKNLAKYLYVDKDGNTGADCSAKSACNSIFEASRKVDEFDVILLSNDLNAETSNVNVDSPITIKSQSDDSKSNLPVKKSVTFKSNENSLFTLGGRTIIKNIVFTISQGAETPDFSILHIKDYLRLESCEFVRGSVINEEDATALQCALIGKPNDYSNPELMINLINCSFSDFILNNASLICTTDKLVLSGCSFTNIVRTIGGGSVAQITSGTVLNIIDCTFKNCSTTLGEGGVINAVVSDCSLLIGGYVSVTTFDNCTASNVNKVGSGDSATVNIVKSYGGAIYIKALTPFTYLNVSNITYTSEVETNNLAYGSCMFVVLDYIGMEWSESNVPILKGVSKDNNTYQYSMIDSPEDVHSLSCLINKGYSSGLNQVFVGDSDVQEPTCDSASSPCASFEEGKKKVIYGKNNFTIVGTLSLNTIVTFKTYDNYFKNNNEESVINVQSNGGLTFYANATFQSVKFSLPELHLGNYFMLCKYGDISLISVVFDVVEDVSTSNVFCLLRVDSAYVNINSCTFSNIACRGSTPAIYLNDCKFNIINSHFISCTSNDDGGALYIYRENYVDGDTHSNISNCEFKDCEAISGGAIYLCILTDTLNIRVNSLTLGENEEMNAATFGSVLFLKAKYLDRICTSTNFAFIPTLSENSEEAVGTGLNSNNYFFLYNLIKGIKNVKMLYVGNKGNDDNSCLSPEDYCRTLEYVKSAYGSDVMNLTIINTLTVQSQYVNFGDKECTIEGKNYYSVIAASSKGGICFNTKAFIKNIKIQINADSSPSYNKDHFIYIDGAEITFLNVTLLSENEDTIISYPLFKGDNIKYEGGYINELSFDGSNGRIFSASKCLTVIGANFVNCNNDKGNGGGIILDSDECFYNIGYDETITSFSGCNAIKGGGIYLQTNTYEANFVLTNIKFGITNKDNTASVGSNIYFLCPYLESVVTKEVFPALLSLTSKDNAYIGCVGDNAGGNAFDLLKILDGTVQTSSYTLYAGEGGSDSNNCNSVDTKCASFDGAFDKIKFVDLTLYVVGNIYSTESLVLNKKSYNIAGQSDSSVIKTNANSQFTLIKDTSFNNLKFDLYGSITSSLLNIKGGSLSLFHIIFSPSSSLSSSSSLLNSYSNEVSNEDICCLQSSLIYKGDSTGDITIVNTSFLNIESRGSGGVISAVLNKEDSLSITGSSFVNCKSLNGNGGAVSANVKEGSTCTIDKYESNSTAFKSCGTIQDNYEYVPIWDEDTTSANSGKGGALYLSVESTTVTLKVAGLDLGTSENGDGNSASEGYDVYVSSEHLSHIVNYENFPYLSEVPEGYSGSVGASETGGEEAKDLVNIIQNPPPVEPTPVDPPPTEPTPTEPTPVVPTDPENPEKPTDPENPEQPTDPEKPIDQEKPTESSSSGFPTSIVIIIVIVAICIIAIVMAILIVVLIVRKRRNTYSSNEEEMVEKEFSSVEKETNNVTYEPEIDQNSY